MLISLHKLKQSSFLCIAAVLVSSCSKSNYLTVGEIATVTEPQGVFIRTGPSMRDRKVILVPFNREFRVLAEGKKETLYGIGSRWYQTEYKGRTGWMWGGLAKNYGADRGKVSENSMASGKCDSLFDYAQKNFKQLSATPGESCGSDTPTLDCGSAVFDRGVKANISCGCHSGGITLELPGASFEDGFKILSACGSVSNCESLSFEKFRSANFDSGRLKGCKNTPEDYKHFKMRRTGNTLILETSAGGI